MSAISKGADDEKGRTRYHGQTDSEFVAELRSHLEDRSWTLGQWVELERRGEELTKGDPTLHTALEQERQPNGDYQWTSKLGHTYTSSGIPP